MGNDISVLRDECAKKHVLCERKVARLLDIKDYLLGDFKWESILAVLDSDIERFNLPDDGILKTRASPMEALERCIRPAKLEAYKETLENNLVSYNLLIEAIESRTTRLLDDMTACAPESGRKAAMHVRSN